jgi:hypothetical protein
MSTLVDDISVYDYSGSGILTREEIMRHLFMSQFCGGHVSGTLHKVQVTILVFIDNSCYGHIAVIVFEERALIKKIAFIHFKPPY